MTTASARSTTVCAIQFHAYQPQPHCLCLRSLDENDVSAVLLHRTYEWERKSRELNYESGDFIGPSGCISLISMPWPIPN